MTNKIKGYKSNLDELTINNSDYRHVLYTSTYLQLVLMNLKVNEDIGLETHKTADQFFKFVAGEGMVIINKTEYFVKEGDVAIVPMGAEHNITNISETKNLKFYTIYSPPEHVDGLVQNLKDR